MTIKRDKKGTPILDFMFNVSNGEIVGLSRSYKFGRAINLGTTQQTIWTGSEDYSFPGSAQTMAVASTNSADKAGVANAAEYLWVSYLSSGHNEMTEIVSLNGLAPVDLSEPLLRINRMKILSTEPSATNTGAIWLGTSNWTAGVPANKFGHILSGKGQTYQAFYTVPISKEIYIYDINITSNEGKESSVEMLVNETVETFSGFPGVVNTLQAKNHYDVFETVFQSQRKIPLCYDEKTDIEFKGTGGTTGTDISVEWSFLIVDKSYHSNTDV